MIYIKDGKQSHCRVLEHEGRTYVNPPAEIIEAEGWEEYLDDRLYGEPNAIFSGYSGTQIRYDGSLKAQITWLDCADWDMSSNTSLEIFFAECSKLKHIDVSRWDVSNCTNFSQIFADCYKLREIDVSQWEVSQATNMSYFFSHCDSLTSIDLSNWHTGNVTRFDYMFNCCLNLREINFGNDFDMGKNTTVNALFYRSGNMERWRGVMKNIKLPFDVFSSKLDRESLVMVINGLYDFAAEGDTDSHKMIFGRTNLQKLTEADIAIATSKGWTLT